MKQLIALLCVAFAFAAIWPTRCMSQTIGERGSAVATPAEGLALSCFIQSSTDVTNVAPATDGLPIVADADPSQSASCEITAEECHGCLSGFWTRPTLTDGLWGLQPALAEKGITYQGFATQWYQGVSSGGAEQVFRYGAKIDQYFIFDSKKLGLWQGGNLVMRAEAIVGQNSIADAVPLAPVNLMALTPSPRGSEIAITHFQYSQAVAEGWALTGGKLNLLDVWAALYPQYGVGRDGFMNISMIAPLSVSPSVPLVFNAAGVLKAGEKGIEGGLFVLDNQNTPTVAGLSNLGENSASILGIYRLFTQFGGRPGSHLAAAAYGFGDFTRFDESGFVQVPGQGLVPVINQKQGAWVAAYVGEQQLWEDSFNPQRKVGMYGYAALGDQNTSIFHYTMSLSIEAFGFLRSREKDRMGMGYFYSGLSEPLKTDLAAIALQDLHGGELYYNYEVNPWFHLTTDLQAIRSELGAQDPALVLGLRGKITF